MKNRNIYLLSLIFVAIAILSACGSKYEGDFSYEVGDFQYTNQEGEAFDSQSLDGKFWVADMVFTNCVDVCMPMTANMAKLQDKLNEEELSEQVELVSFTIDPDNDTPEILKEYSQQRGGEFDNWNLLTGYTFEEIKQLSITSFKAPLEKISDSDQFVHVTSFYLITPEGKAVKRYDGTVTANVDEIVKDIKKMN